MQMKRKLTQLRNLVADHQVISLNNISIPQEILIQSELIEENISKLKEITKLMKKNQKVIESNLQYNTSLGEIFDQYSRSANISASNKILCSCLQDASLFQMQISRSKTQMDEKVNQILYTTIKNFIDDGLKPATETKKKYEKDAKEYDAMISKLKSQKKNGKLDPKREQELEQQLNEMKRTYEATEKDTLELLRQANQKSELITILKIVEYWESCIKFYKEGIQHLESLAPKIEKYKAYARRTSTQKPKQKLFKQPLETICERESRRVPKIIVSACNYITKEGIDIQGIFRVSATKSSMEALKDHVEETNDYDFTKHGPIVVSGLLKLFLRELPDPLFTFERYKSFLSVARIEDEGKQVEEIKKHILTLPLYNYKTIQHIVKMCVLISQSSDINKMNESNLSTVLAPNLLYTNDIDPLAMVYEMEQANNIFTLIIKNYSTIFNVEDFELDALDAPPHEEVISIPASAERKLRKNKSYRQVGSLREKSTRKMSKKINRHTNNISDFDEIRARSSSFSDISIMDPSIFDPNNSNDFNYDERESLSPLRSSPRQLKKSKGSLKNIFVSDSNLSSKKGQESDDDATTPTRSRKDKKKKKKSLTPDVSGLRRSKKEKKHSEKSIEMITDETNNTNDQNEKATEQIENQGEEINIPQDNVENSETINNIKDNQPDNETVTETKENTVDESSQNTETSNDKIKIDESNPNNESSNDTEQQNEVVEDDRKENEKEEKDEIEENSNLEKGNNEENKEESNIPLNQENISPNVDMDSEVKPENPSTSPETIKVTLESDELKESLLSDTSKESLTTIPTEVNELLKSNEFKLSSSIDSSIDSLVRSDSIVSESLPLSIPDPISEIYPLLVPGNFTELESSLCNLISCSDRTEYSENEKKAINDALKEVAKYTKILLSQTRGYVSNFPEMKDSISSNAVNVQKDIRNIIISLKDFHNNPMEEARVSLFQNIQSFNSNIYGVWSSSLTSLKIQIDSSLELAIQKTASHISKILRAALSKTLDDEFSNIESNFKLDINEVIRIAYLRSGLLSDCNAHDVLEASIQELKKSSEGFIKCLAGQNSKDDSEEISMDLSVQAKNLVKSFRTIESVIKDDTLEAKNDLDITELKNNLSNLTIAVATKVFKNTSLSLESKLLVLGVGPYVRRLIKDARRWIQNDISNFTRRDLIENTLSIKNQVYEIISLINYHQLDGNLNKEDEELILTNISSLLVYAVKILMFGSNYSLTKDPDVLKQFISTLIILLKLIETALTFEKNY